MCNLYGNKLIPDIYRHFEGLLTGSFKKFADFSQCIFSYSRSVFRTVSTITDGASCENSQQFLSKMEPFAKIKPVNCFWKTLHLICLTGFWMRLLSSVHILEFECQHSRLFQLQGLVVLHSFWIIISFILKADQLKAHSKVWDNFW